MFSITHVTNLLSHLQTAMQCVAPEYEVTEYEAWFSYCKAKRTSVLQNPLLYRSVTHKKYYIDK